MNARVLSRRALLVTGSFLVSSCVVSLMPVNNGVASELANPLPMRQVGLQEMPAASGVIVCETEVTLTRGVTPQLRGGCPPTADAGLRKAHEQEIQNHINQITNSADFMQGKARHIAITVVTKKTPSQGRKPVQATASIQENEQNLTPKQRKLRELARNQEMQNEAFNNTILEGAVIGAALGAGISALPIPGGGTAQDLLKRAAIGAAAGAVTGALAGKYVAYKQQQYTNREDQVNSMITDVRQLNQENQAILDKMREVLAEDKRKIVDLKKQYQRKKISEEQYQRELAVVKSDRKLMNSMVLKAENRLTVFKEARTAFMQTNPDANVQNYNKEVENSQATIKAMQQVANDLAVVA